MCVCVLRSYKLIYFFFYSLRSIVTIGVAASPGGVWDHLPAWHHGEPAHPPRRLQKEHHHLTFFFVSVWLPHSLSVCVTASLPVCLCDCLTPCLSVWLPHFLSVCVTVSLPVCLCDCLTHYLSVWLSHSLSVSLTVSLNLRVNLTKIITCTSQPPPLFLHSVHSFYMHL